MDLDEIIRIINRYNGCYITIFHSCNKSVIKKIKDEIINLKYLLVNHYIQYISNYFNSDFLQFLKYVREKNHKYDGVSLPSNMNYGFIKYEIEDGKYIEIYYSSEEDVNNYLIKNWQSKKRKRIDV